jgi:hypothetical protein
MTALEKLDKIKKLIFGEAAPAAPAAPGQSFPLANGSNIILNPGLEIGATATINDEPAADGDYPFPEGSVVTIVGGVVDCVETPEEENAPESIDMASEITQLQEKLASITAKFSSQFEGLVQLTELVREIARQPIAAPVEPIKNPFRTQSFKEEKLAQLADNLIKLRAEQE